MQETDQLAKIIWDFNDMHHTLRKADVILVLESNDIRVAERGAELFLQGYASLIVFSGNVGRLSKGLWDKPEAGIFADAAIRMGVPKEKIIIENRSTNTGENIQFTRELLKEKGIDPMSFIVVQKPYMQKRAYATFMKQWPGKEVIMAAPQIQYDEYPNDVVSREHLITVMVGDLQRLKLYPEKGFQIPIDIPPEVWHAYEELVKAGYTSHLVTL